MLVCTLFVYVQYKVYHFMYTSALVQLYCIVYCTQCLLSPLSHVHNCTQYSVRNVFTHPPELYNCTPVHNVFSHPMSSGDKSAGSAAAGAAAGDYTLVKKFSSFKYSDEPLTTKRSACLPAQVGDTCQQQTAYH